MSQAAIAPREENRDGRLRNSAANSNMVTSIKDIISCTKSMESYNSPDSKAGIVSFPCDFDHMYASMTEGMVSSKEKNEYKHLKEICLQHLDLIQQQSELLAKQEKQILSLRQENGKLKQRLQRRSGHQGRNCDTQDAEMTLNRSDVSMSRHHRSPNSSDRGKRSLLRSIRSLSPHELTHNPMQWRRSAQWRQGEDGGASLNSEGEIFDDSSTTTFSQRSNSRIKRICTSGRKRQRGRRSLSIGSREGNGDEETHQDGSSSEGQPLKRPKKETDLISEGGISQSSAVLTTVHPYHTATGSSDSGWALGEMCIETEPEPDVNGDVLEIPQWRVKVYTSLYSMEGTENLDDEVFLKRHHRLEVDERRRKRWDVQRIREQRHIEKLKQRELASSSVGGSSKGNFSAEDEVYSLWPNPDDAQFLQVDDELPVAAFGLPITKFTPSEFSLPWLRSGSNENSKSTVKRHQRNQRSTSGRLVRKRLGRRGGGKSSLSLSVRRGDVSEKK